MLMSIRNLQKRFGDHEVLQGVNLDIEKGDVVVILGPSGSGKTTFLRSLNFLERADGGTVDFDDRHYDLQEVSDRQIAEVRQKTAFVFQNYNLFANKTALENVTLGLTAGRGVKKEEALRIRPGSGQPCGLYGRGQGGGRRLRRGNLHQAQGGAHAQVPAENPAGRI